MEVKKITLISNNICYGPSQKADEEVEQRLTILKNGRVWFSGYNYGSGYGKFEIGRKIQLSIGKKQAIFILEKINKFFKNKNIDMFATDIGLWELLIVNENNEVNKFSGSLFGGVIEDNIDLTELIRKSIPIENLFVFDDLDYEDEI